MSLQKDFLSGEVFQRYGGNEKAKSEGKMKKATVIMILGLALGALIFPGRGYAIGSGGLLVEVPYAKVLVNGVLQKDWKAFVHPFEGSWLVIVDGGSRYLAIDRVKRHSGEIQPEDVLPTEYDSVVDVPEESPISVFPGRPRFAKLWTEADIPELGVLRIEVDR